MSLYEFVSVRRLSLRKQLFHNFRALISFKLLGWGTGKICRSIFPSPGARTITTTQGTACYLLTRHYYLSATLVSNPSPVKLLTARLHHPTSPFPTVLLGGTSPDDCVLDRYDIPRLANGSTNSVATPLQSANKVLIE